MSKIYSFDQLTDSVELLERKPPRFIAWLLGFLIVVLLGFIIWAYVGKIDIVSKGTAIVQGKSDISVSRVQVTGIVDTVFVRSGDEVKQGDALIQLKNQELMDKQNQMDQIVKHLEGQKAMLEQFKKSVQSHKSSFSDEVDKKIKEEYKAYEQGYQSLQNEKENEIKQIADSKLVNEQDEVLQGLIAEKENIQREIKSIEKQKIKENILEEQKQLLDDKVDSFESQKNSVEKRIQQREKTLESERRKVDITREGKQEQKQDALNQYKENTITSINQRIQPLEQEIFVKKQEMDGLRNQSEATIIKAKKDGVVQFPFIVQQGDLIDPGQEIVSIIPKEDEKKVKILLPAQEIKGIKKGDKVQYSFKLKKTDKQIGKVTYVSAHPIFDKESKSYMYELEATIDTKELQELHAGMLGKGSVVTGEEPIWKFILRKLNLI
ncbi:HlyD family efflux transporter periplasmic adaptor subunit (plasmid) [Bacillus mycoides]|uniref:HlyD family efflux transporter periplasmic adaptor subunit n=1 Tax=Bacillus mycoides TaxID=1405 RepID=UPI001C01D80B|nr:HlyD family efflux transporter periplasmic adaptor subunit [Bacillus mycoides]QWG48396.1 HlyD family efflux transporter periplasmic adaptor subunit [Bacillus mycoides]